VGAHQKRVNLKIAIKNGSHDDFLLNCNIGRKKHNADLLPLTASGFSQALFQVSATRKLWLSSTVEAWKFTENKLLKLVNSMKIDFLLAGLNLNIIIQKKASEEIHVSWIIL